MNEYTKVNWQDGTVLQPAKVTIDGTDYNVEPAVESGTTPVNATNLDKMDTALKQAHDGVRNMEVNKINKATIELLTVDSTAPEECATGDMYYNTTTNLIYTATGTNTWGTTGEAPSSKYLYVDLSNSKLYYYDGSSFTSYGGGASNDVVISPTEPTVEDWKIWVDNSEQEDNTYYNDNGTPTQFKATTYDTLPVGTEVEYDGQTVPNGWTEVSSSVVGLQKNAFGDVLITDGTYSATLYGKVVGTYIGNTIWRIDIEGEMEYSNIGPSYYNYGISINKINTLLGLNLRNYSQSEKTSSYMTYVPDSGLDLAKIKYMSLGYGTTYEYKEKTINNNLEKFFTPARYYTTSGSVGSWGIDLIPNKSFFKTTLYLKEA